MRVVFFSYGTRGDAQPQVALAAGLEQHGFTTRITAPENLRSFVERAGIDYAPLHGNSQEILESDSGKRWLESGNVAAFMKEAAAISARIDPEVFRCGLEAAHDADAIVGGTLAEDLAFTLAEYKRIPFAFAHTIPMETTGDYANPFVTRRNLPLRGLNRATFALFRVLAGRMHTKTLAEFRKTLGLPQRSGTVVSRAAELDVPVLQLWSQHLLPHQSDAPAKTVTTGFQRLPQNVRDRLGEKAPPEDLVRWLDAGPPPVYVGFGSMPVPSLIRFAEDILEIGRSIDVRFALSPGWNEIESVRHLQCDGLHLVPPIDHGWLFQRCVAAVHHGGAGTTAASLEAGIPTVVCSFFADQPFWGVRVERLGVGAHLPWVKMNTQSLRNAVETALTDDVRRRAREIGAKLRAEDGNARAVEALIRVLAPAEQELRKPIETPA
ncbi:MAG: glycosyltransferase family 1 protein [Rhodobacter sp.]|jgi:sterol 3beta-glucosyltransferase|nr:glycosyltransferase family 1 protein [Rhodobacter sp.]